MSYDYGTCSGRGYNASWVSVDDRDFLLPVLGLLTIWKDFRLLEVLFVCFCERFEGGQQAELICSDSGRYPSTSSVFTIVYSMPVQ